MATNETQGQTTQCMRDLCRISEDVYVCFSLIYPWANWGGWTYDPTKPFWVVVKRLGAWCVLEVYNPDKRGTLLKSSGLR